MWTLGEMKRIRWIVESESGVGREEDMFVCCTWYRVLLT